MYKYNIYKQYIHYQGQPCNPHYMALGITSALSSTWTESKVLLLLQLSDGNGLLLLLSAKQTSLLLLLGHGRRVSDVVEFCALAVASKRNDVSTLGAIA